MQGRGSGSTTRAGRVPNWGCLGRAGLAERLSLRMEDWGMALCSQTIGDRPVGKA